MKILREDGRIRTNALTMRLRFLDRKVVEGCEWCQPVWPGTGSDSLDILGFNFDSSIRHSLYCHWPCDTHRIYYVYPPFQVYLWPGQQDPQAIFSTFGAVSLSDRWVILDTCKSRNGPGKGKPPPCGAPIERSAVGGNR